MTDEQIKEYKDSVGNFIRLFGYTSTSLSKDQAMGFAWENKHSGHHKVLFHIKWNGAENHYFLNAGAFDHEQEILLKDGLKIDVISIEDAKDEEGNKLYTLITLKYWVIKFLNWIVSYRIIEFRESRESFYIKY